MVIHITLFGYLKGMTNMKFSDLTKQLKQQIEEQKQQKPPHTKLEIWGQDKVNEIISLAVAEIAREVYGGADDD